ncbi:DoxX family protein [Aquimarina sp. RZ0]|uniref:DoxX family protein n=1 Tax=Aquimarina sp. RZ0 TaxID=2607730 RepID=UPI0011F16751|nr:DoxX family protein [Aquimarina sp. RZ0]KAA1245604.1 DoxX family protein [Aquimarina sp. RZ0]
MKTIFIKLFLRASIAFGFLSAVADRLGFWSKEKSAWGSWDNFIEYTQVINPWFPNTLINAIGTVTTGAEIILAIFLLIGFKTSLSATISGFLLLIFSIAMTLSLSVKAPLDYSVFSAAAAAFGVSLLKEQYLEIDILLNKKI